jgi:hypothetical protein
LTPSTLTPPKGNLAYVDVQLGAASPPEAWAARATSFAARRCFKLAAQAFRQAGDAARCAANLGWAPLPRPCSRRNAATAAAAASQLPHLDAPHTGRCAPAA